MRASSGPNLAPAPFVSAISIPPDEAPRQASIVVAPPRGRDSVTWHNIKRGGTSSADPDSCPVRQTSGLSSCRGEQHHLSPKALESTWALFRDRAFPSCCDQLGSGALD